MKMNCFKKLLILFLWSFTTVVFSQSTLLIEDFNYTAGDALTNHGWNETGVTPPIVKTDYKMLMVGNSFTFYNSGVDYHLQLMLNVDKSADSINYNIQEIAVSSYTLQAHYGDPLTINKIASDKWNLVVLQEQSTRPINNPDLFLLYAQKLDLEIKKVGAKTALYMTWPPKASQTDITTIAASYISVGQNLNAKVVPVGKVWQYFIGKYPSINLYYTDGVHPSLFGTYLNACCFYYSIFGKNPVNNTYVPTGMNSADAVTIRKAVYDYLLVN
jgi:hypothetical protein